MGSKARRTVREGRSYGTVNKFAIERYLFAGRERVYNPATDERLPKAGTSGGGWVYSARYGKPKRKFRFIESGPDRRRRNKDHDQTAKIRSIERCSLSEFRA